MIVHTVQKGDTLWKLAKKYGVPLESIIAANPQVTDPDKIDVGQKINIPRPGESVSGQPIVEPHSAHEPPEAHTGFPGAPAEEPNMPIPATPMHTAPPFTGTEPKWGHLWKYVVKHGDTMWKIAKQVGVTLDQLKVANPQVMNPDHIMPGQVINIPSHGMMNGASHHLSIKEQMMPKEKLTAPKPYVSSPIPKEQLTAPKEIVPPSIPKEVPFMEPKPFKMEIPKMEVPKMEMPKMEAPKMPPVVHHAAPHTDIVQQQLYYAPHYHPVYHPMMVMPVHMVPHHVYDPHKKCGCKKRHRKHKCKHYVTYYHPHLMPYYPHHFHMPHPPVTAPHPVYPSSMTFPGREFEGKN